MSRPAANFKRVRRAPTPANRLSLDYEAEARSMPAPPAPIIDVHSHIGGAEASRIYAQVAEAFGVALTWSMTHLEDIPAVRAALGDRVRFIAVPDYRAENRRHAFGDGFLDRIEAFHAAGAEIVKFWAAPRSMDYALEAGDPDLLRLDAPARIEAMELAASLGMKFMTHVGDPDTWFTARYTDSSRYGTKLEQYAPLERVLERFEGPWIAAHMGGWPEDLSFVSGLLDRHPNLHLDTSATKWMVRELSRHPRAELVAFLDRYRGRVLFGSDIVTTDEHLDPRVHEGPGAGAGSAAEAFDLYASRYWALRVLFETSWVGPSPIADPDLSLVDPHRYGPLDAPPLIGKHLPADLLATLYHGAARALLG